ncbi:MAG: ABC transporter permease [Chloroflexi bacterium]|nr:ABC transporter permease [Chloroflexota bacterium]
MSTRYLIGRLGQTVLVIVIVSMMTYFFLSVLPGDAVTAQIGADAGGFTEERLARDLGLDKPLPLQYVDWAGRMLTGNWGTSIRTKESVLDALWARAPVTLQLTALAMVISIVIAIPVGVIAALRRNSWVDRLSTTGAVAGVALPNFWFAILLILLLSVRFEVLPASGYVDPLEHPIDALKHLLMPAVVLGMAQSATIMRQMRSSMLEVMGQDYVRTARAKGLSGYRVVVGHALRNALIPVVTLLGLRLANILGGTIIIEQVFALPGMGRLAVQAIFAQDLPVVMGFVLVVALIVQIANLVTDLSYGLIDPRIQLGRGRS